MNNYQGSDAVSECCPRYEKKPRAFIFHLYLTANNSGIAEKMQCNLCREATASQISPILLPHSQAKHLYLV